jgi:NAD(P)-dependent dehydrogenase (short-subunit alcohol dehydrogenase family)
MEERKSNSNGNLNGKRVLVLGGSSGIGLAVAEAVAAAGADVVIASSNPDRVQTAVTALRERAQGYTLDLSDEEAIKAFFLNIGNFDHPCLYRRRHIVA